MNDDLVQRVRERAYKIWEENGRPDGREIEHWLQAERDLSRDRGQAPDISSSEEEGGFRRLSLLKIPSEP
jgi:hypothetical protein